MPQSDSLATGLSSTNLEVEVGKVIIDLGLATRTEVEFCREQQKQSSDPNQRSLTDILIEHNFITVNQAKRIRQQLDERRKSRIPGYKLLEEIGKGAMATVFKAKQESLDRIVAVKVLPKRLADNKEFVERFYKEGRAAARLSHNNIVQAYDVGASPEGYHYFVMEYIEGKSLYDLMQEGRTFSEAEALEIVIQVGDALAHAHERGLIHRDVKPKNVILTPQGVAKLTDLGLARAVDDKAAAESEAGKAYGTPYYISPEQIRGEVNIDFRTDIYSLGATLYHLVTGHPPFEGETPTAVMHKHLKEPLVPPDHLNTALSAGLSEIVEVAMAKKREDRYASTRDMLDDLKAVARNEPPFHARRTVDLESLARVEETGKTVDIAPAASEQPLHERSAVTMWLLVALAGSVIVNLVLILLMASK